MTAKPVKFDLFKKVAGDKDYRHDGLYWLRPGDSVSISVGVEVKLDVDASGQLMVVAPRVQPERIQRILDL